MTWINRPPGSGKDLAQAENLMLDTLMLIAGLAGFALTVLYAYACDHM
ncbi:MAG TPA: hypothetical protein VGL83_05085 [Stellaceae bacterium]